MYKAMTKCRRQQGRGYIVHKMQLFRTVAQMARVLGLLPAVPLPCKHCQLCSDTAANGHSRKQVNEIALYSSMRRSCIICSRDRMQIVRHSRRSQNSSFSYRATNGSSSSTFACSESTLHTSPVSVRGDRPPSRKQRQQIITLESMARALGLAVPAAQPRCPSKHIKLIRSQSSQAD